jgi:hypothetical protein
MPFFNENKLAVIGTRLGLGTGIAASISQDIASSHILTPDVTSLMYGGSAVGSVIAINLENSNLKLYRNKVRL